MCGIGFLITLRNRIKEERNLKRKNFSSSLFNQQLLQLLLERGPDYLNHLSQTLFQNENFQLNIQIYSSVLHMRGENITKQPIQKEQVNSDNNVVNNEDILLKNFLCWNGEIFSGEILIDNLKNDGIQLFERLNEITEKFSEIENEDLIKFEISQVISKIEGPFAFIFWDVCFYFIYSYYPSLILKLIRIFY